MNIYALKIYKGDIIFLEKNIIFTFKTSLHVKIKILRGLREAHPIFD